MAEIKENFALRSYNSFGIESSARYFTSITEETELEKILASKEFKSSSCLILGGGSNILFTNNFDGFVVHSQIKGITIVNENTSEIWLRVGSGVEWDELVEFAVENNWGGIENLTDIPGNVGAAPVQNIGAYGVEAMNTIERVEGINLANNKKLTFTNSECEFGYRNSIFKKQYQNKILITYVTFRLKKAPHVLVDHYGNVMEELEKGGEYTIQAIRNSIRKIRSEKLPSIKEIGSAGSFFKNPVVAVEIAHKILALDESAPAYPTESGLFKLSAAWLIDKSGCKGITIGNAGTHAKQPLVIINKGNAGGQEILSLSIHIQQKVFDKFGVELEPEVNII